MTYADLRQAVVTVSVVPDAAPTDSPLNMKRAAQARVAATPRRTGGWDELRHAPFHRGYVLAVHHPARCLARHGSRSSACH